MEYCCSIWGNCSKENINIIVKLQKRAARLILDVDFFTPSANLFKELKWIPFSDIVKYHQVSLVYKCIHKISPEYLHDMFSIKLDSKRYNFRSSNTGRLDVPKKYNRSLSFNGPKLWNSLDSKTRQAISHSVFQSKVFNFLSGLNCDKLTE